MIVIDFEPEHLNLLVLQPMQSHIKFDKEYARNLKAMGKAWSLFNDDTIECIACAGVIDLGSGRGLGWALLGEKANKHLGRITREIKKRLPLGFQRIEVTVDKDFAEAFRWAVMLGFVCETPMGMVNYHNGQTHYLFARTSWPTQ